MVRSCTVVNQSPFLKDSTSQCTSLLSPLPLKETLLEEGGESTFYGSDADEDEDEEEEEDKEKKEEALAKRKPYVMDPDHRLLLRNTKPLLQSRNAAVSYTPPPLLPPP